MWDSSLGTERDQNRPRFEVNGFWSVLGADAGDAEVPSGQTVNANSYG